MQFEAVRRVTVGDLAFEVGRQVYDVDGVERAFLRADTTSNAEAFTDESDFAVGCDFDTELAGLDNRAGLLAFLPAFLRFAFVRIDDGDTMLSVSGSSGGGGGGC